MNITVEMILGAIAVIFLAISAKDYFANDQIMTPKIKTRLRVALIFCIVIIVKAVVIKN